MLLSAPFIKSRCQECMYCRDRKKEDLVDGYKIEKGQSKEMIVVGKSHE